MVTFSQAQKQVRLGLAGMSYKEPLKVCNLKDRPKIGKVENYKTPKVW